MTRRIITRFALVAAALVGVLGIGLYAHAQGPHGGHGRGHHAMMEAAIDARLDDALDAVKATAPQRQAVYAAKDHVVDTMKQSHSGMKGDIDRAIALFTADRVDTRALAELRARHEKGSQTVGDAVVQAASDVHDALTAEQRQALATYVRAELPQHGGGWKMRFFRRIADAKVNAMLDTLAATPEQRTKVAAIEERLFTAFGEAHADRGPMMEKAITLLTADTLDRTAIGQLRAEHQARMKKLGDVVTQAAIDLHDTLDGAQRQKLVQEIQSHRAHWEK